MIGLVPKQVSVTVETRLNKRLHIRLLPLLLLLSATATAQWAEFPTGDLDSRTLRIQIKAEGLYEKGDFKRAHFIYSSELARLGDKYAQYMTGYMYLMGQGVAEDPVRASAWYRMAAERRSPEFVAVRDELLSTLSTEERARSDALYLELRRELSDIVIVMKLLEDDLEDLQTETTGSRVAARSSAVIVIDPDTGAPMSADHYRNRILRTVQTRLDFVTERLDIDPLNARLAAPEIDGLWARITEHIAVVDDDGDTFVATP